MPIRHDADGAAAVETYTGRPNSARVCNYLLGGKDHFAVDRAEAERLLQICPTLRDRARENRRFLARAVSWLAGQGIRQFLDIGCGLPAALNTHQVAQDADPSCRVVYSDNDPVVTSHAMALLTGPGVGAVQGDLRDPAAIMSDPAVVELINPGDPTALILSTVLQSLDASDACQATAALVDWLAPGSYVVISGWWGDEPIGEELAREHNAGSFYNHSPAKSPSSSLAWS
jgi:hypothetical protein